MNKTEAIAKALWEYDELQTVAENKFSDYQHEFRPWEEADEWDTAEYMDKATHILAALVQWEGK